MHPTIAVGVALVTWLAVHDRPVLTRTLLAFASFMLGWEPASRESRFGLLLVFVAAGAALSLAWDGLRAVVRPRRPGVAVAADRPAVDLDRGFDPDPDPGLDPDARRREPMTELDQATLYGTLLDANIAGLRQAQDAGDVVAQAAFAGEIASLARTMRSALRVVVGDRHSLAHPRNP